MKNTKLLIFFVLALLVFSLPFASALTVSKSRAKRETTKLGQDSNSRTLSYAKQVATDVKQASSQSVDALQFTSNRGNVAAKTQRGKSSSVKEYAREQNKMARERMKLRAEVRRGTEKLPEQASAVAKEKIADKSEKTARKVLTSQDRRSLREKLQSSLREKLSKRSK